MLLLPAIRPPVPRSGGIADRATAGAIGSLETWAIELVRQLSKLDVTAGGALVGGVSAVNGGTNITVSPTTGSVTVSLNPSVALSGTLSVTGATTLNGTLTLSTLTAGSVLFAGVGGLVSQDNANFFWDDSADVLRIGGTTSAAASTSYSQFSGTRWRFRQTAGDEVNAGCIDYRNFNASELGIVGAGTGASANSRMVRVYDALTVTSVDGTPAVHARNSSTTVGAMSIRNTNASGPVDFYAADSAGTATVSWGYGNASYSDTSRAGRGYLWRNTGVNFVFARTNTVDSTLFSSGNWRLGATVTDPGVKLQVDGAFTYTGNGVWGDATTDTHTANGAITIEGPVGFGLDVKSLTQANARIWGDSNNSGSDAGYTGLVIARGTTPTELWYLGRDGTTPSDAFILRRAGTTNDLTVDTSGNATFAGNLSCNGNLTAGDSSTIDTHTIRGRTTVDDIASAATAQRIALTMQSSGTYNTTAGAITAYGMVGNAIATRSAGGNNLTNVGLYTNASGAQVNQALVTDNGNVVLNNTSGTTTIKGALTCTSTIAVDGNCTFGNASTDTVTVAGTNFNFTNAAIITSGAGTGIGITAGTTVSINTGPINSDAEIVASRDIYLDGTVKVQSSGGSARNMTVGGTLSVNGNTTIGNASGDAHVVNGSLDCNDNVNIDGTLVCTGAAASPALDVRGDANICDAAGDTLKFHGGTGATQQTVTGSRGGNAALADLLTKLATLGLIVDGTTA